jgi:hypothetical protein
MSESFELDELRVELVGMKEIVTQQDELGKKDRKIAIVVSMAAVAAIFLLGLAWSALMGPVPVFEVPEWETIAMFEPGADYGIDDKGSSDINNFQAPSPNASNDNPPSNDNASPKPTNAVTPAGDLTQHTDGTPDVKETPNSDTKGTNTTTGPATPTDNPGKNPNGGSNDGNTNQVGNTGHPEATVLNENGRFKWGNGIGGPDGRRPVSTQLKGYNIQKEDKITYDIVISPEGEVLMAKAKFFTSPELAQIGKNNILNWKFSETDPSAGNLKTTVEITFKLK